MLLSPLLLAVAAYSSFFMSPVLPFLGLPIFLPAFPRPRRQWQVVSTSETASSTDAALYKQLSAMTRLASATATMREDARREAAARGGGGDMEDSGSDDDDDEETAGPRGDDDAATAATLRRLLRRLGAYPVILICAWFFPTLNRVVNMFKGGDTTGDVYALYVLQAIGMSTQGVGNVIAYGMSAAVRKHVAETMARACGGGLGSGGDARAGVEVDAKRGRTSEGGGSASPIEESESESELAMLGGDSDSESSEL